MPENGKETKMDKNIFYRSIPKVDILLEDERIQNAASIYERDTVMDAIREQTEFAWTDPDMRRRGDDPPRN